MEEKKTKKRTRGNGEGSIFFNKSKNLWVAEITVGFDENGKQVQKSFYGKLRKDVVEKLKVKQAELKGILYSSDVIKLSDVIDLFMADKKSTNLITDNTYLAIVNSANIIKKNAISNLDIKKISEKDINQFLLTLKDYSNSVIRKAFLLLSNTFNKAVLTKIIAINPFSNKGAIICPKSNKQDKKIDSLTIEEQKLFLNELKTTSSKCNKNVLYIEMFLGLRAGEVLALQKDDIDLENKRISIKRTLTINDKSKVIIGNSTKTFTGERTIPITNVVLPFVTSALENYVENPNHLIFLNSSAKICRVSEYNAFFKQTCKDAGIRVTTKILTRVKNGKETKINHMTSEVNQHMLRHTFATRAIESGIDPVILQHILGHKDICITLNTYTTIFEKHKAEKLDLVSDYLEKLF